MAHVKTLSPIVLLAASLKDTATRTIALGVSVAQSIGAANSQAAQFEAMNNLTDVELANTYKINRDQIPAYIFSGLRG